MTLGQIADIHQARGRLDESLRIQREQELPVYEALGAKRDRLVCLANIAIVHLMRKKPGDRTEATRLLREALRDAAAMKLPEADQIRAIMKQVGIAP